MFAFNLRFPGQYLDTETGLHYNYFRDYEPVVGRYVESDPIGLRGGAQYLRLFALKSRAQLDPDGLEQICGDRFCGSDLPAFPRKRPDPSECGCSLRWPDYVTFQLDMYVFSVSSTYTHYGDVFFGKGFSRQYRNPLARGVSISDGWLLKCNPTQQDINDFLIGWSASAGGYAGFGGSYSFNSAGSALNFGVGLGEASFFERSFFASPGIVNSYQGNLFDEE